MMTVECGVSGNKRLEGLSPDMGTDTTLLQAQDAPLFELPEGVLTSERRIVELLSQLGESSDSFVGKLRFAERHGLLPFVTGSPLLQPIHLHLKISDDLSLLTVSAILRKLSPEELAGDVKLENGDLYTLAEIRDPTLLFSTWDLTRGARGSAERERAVQLFTLGRRVTEFRGVSVTWDQGVDQNVWTTNIDTIFFLSRLFENGVFERSDLRKTLEVGVGGGAISKTLLTHAHGIETHAITDISAHALMAAKRNIEPILPVGTSLELFLGKGIASFGSAVDLMLVNPPYIPHMRRHDAVDPYRGTGLIQEVLSQGLSHLNARNPEACIYLGVSSLAARDIADYLQEVPEVRVEQVGASMEVPLKILAINEDKEWIDYLVREHGLIDSSEREAETGFRYWHTLSVLKVAPKECSATGLV